jgi:murein DD-endopeptidase MepM/ murein hydrolase activator NlpD
LNLSSTLARHRKPPPSSADGPPAASRRQKLSAIVSVFRHPVRIAAVAVVGSAALVAAWPATAHWVARASDQAWVGQADVLGLQFANSLGLQIRLQPEVVSEGVAVAPIYLNPLRDVSGLVLERIDQGVDFNGSGPVYALGDGVVTNASAFSPGWGGAWITYQLTNGAAAGLTVYLAEAVAPTVVVGQHVTPSTVIGDMFDGAGGIEIGWAQPGGVSAESQLPEAGAIGGAGPFPTTIGTNFDELLQSLGVPAAPNRYQTPSGLLPADYPTSW